ncbi:hypothetical protein DRQ25_13825, partial [Candidatus Fermentibacteria bacterium]
RTEVGRSGDWLTKKQSTDPLDKLWNKLGPGGGTGSVSIDGLSHSGIASVNRKTYGFGSRSIWNKVLTFARKTFKNPKSATSFEKMVAPMSEKEILTTFGRETATFNPAQIRSGRMDSFLSSRMRAAEKIKATKQVIPEGDDLLQQLIAPVMPHKQAKVFGGSKKAFSAEEMRGMSGESVYEKMGFRSPEFRGPKGLEDDAQRMLAADKADRAAKKQALHNRAQKDFWNNANKPGKGHISQSANFSGNLDDTILRARGR